MTTTLLESMGFLAAFLTTAAFVPQVIKVWRENDTAAISLGMYCMFVVGILLWLVYGVMIGSRPMTFSNIITFLLATSILLKKIQHVKQARRATLGQS